jgi:hypothetical protein
MNNPERMKVGHTGHDLRKLNVIKNRKCGIRGRIANELTNSKRFTSGLDLAYSITFPFRIQSETIRKHWGSVEIETPKRGKMFGWDKRFQPIISRQNRCVQTE